jgi:hypothetical protein
LAGHSLVADAGDEEGGEEGGRRGKGRLDAPGDVLCLVCVWGGREGRREGGKDEEKMQRKARKTNDNMHPLSSPASLPPSLPPSLPCFRTFNKDDFPDLGPPSTRYIFVGSKTVEILFSRATRVIWGGYLGSCTLENIGPF